MVINCSSSRQVHDADHVNLLVQNLKIIIKHTCSSESPSASLSSPSAVTDGDVGQELQMPAAPGAADTVVKRADFRADCTAGVEWSQACALT